MAIYAIGDIQGCYRALNQLLDKLQLTTTDRVWFVGDLVNRGPESLEVLRLVHSMGSQAITVLGNHDIHLLCVARGARPSGTKDTLSAVLNASDRELLLHWLGNRPLFHYDSTISTAMVHAGVLPNWSLEQCLSYSASVNQILASKPSVYQLQALYGNHPTSIKYDRRSQHHRMLVNVFTRMRFCTTDGSLDYRYKGAPGSQPKGLLPWFVLPNRKLADIRLIFGHWSALGLYQQPSLLGLDTGCIWGGQLTAARLDSRQPELLQV